MTPAEAALHVLARPVRSPEERALMTHGLRLLPSDMMFPSATQTSAPRRYSWSLVLLSHNRFARDPLRRVLQLTVGVEPLSVERFNFSAARTSRLPQRAPSVFANLLRYEARFDDHDRRIHAAVWYEACTADLDEFVEDARVATLRNAEDIIAAHIATIDGRQWQPAKAYAP